MSVLSALLDALGHIHVEPVGENNNPCPPTDKVGDAFVMSVDSAAGVSCAYEGKITCVYFLDGTLDTARSDSDRCFDTRGLLTQFVSPASTSTSSLNANPSQAPPSQTVSRAASDPTSLPAPDLSTTIIPVFLESPQTENELAQSLGYFSNPRSRAFLAKLTGRSTRRVGEVGRLFLGVPLALGFLLLLLQFFRRRRMNQHLQQNSYDELPDSPRPGWRRTARQKQ
ncbi:hypothetical protein B0H16DRAFT_1694928 [Mycena metata]|uniref:Uncharacterized protein n=1 Tax=Mycena metata TaxID=1033252 RepID=A0AAD7MY75_9AGAR|nr:hypothetical protein B0H16DRAFT_1694928 [Mycena metata]